MRGALIHLSGAIASRFRGTASTTLRGRLDPIFSRLHIHWYIAIRDRRDRRSDDSDQGIATSADFCFRRQGHEAWTQLWTVSIEGRRLTGWEVLPCGKSARLELSVKAGDPINPIRSRSMRCLNIPR